MSNLQQIAVKTCKAMYLTDQRIAEIKAQLTSDEMKYNVARAILKEAAMLYSISDEELDTIARGFVNPATRRGAEQSIGQFPFKDPKTEWVGHGWSLIMDRLFAEDDPNADVHVLALPGRWSFDLWHSERDLCEDGYRYSSWVYATLPHIIDYDDMEPVAYVLVSDDLYGTLYWGDKTISIYRGEVSVSEHPMMVRVMDIITESAEVTV